VVIGDWSDDDPGVAAQDEEAEPVSSRELVELEPAAAVLVVPVWLTAMPAPRLRNNTALSMPATTRDRAAGWRRRAGRRVPPRRGPGAGGGLWSITIPLIALTS
jgi:hypothetical protein